MKKRYNNHLVFITFCFCFLLLTSVVHSSSDVDELRGRGLKSFKEKASNITFDCSPSGPCVPCLYNEKKDVSYRCSETGYRIPMRCLQIATPVDDESNKHIDYVTYRSCIPNQQNLSLLSFEAIMLLLLIISSFVIFRRKASFLRLPTNPRVRSIGNSSFVHA